MTCEYCKNGLIAGGQVCQYCNGTGQIESASQPSYNEGDKVDFKPGTNLLTQNGTFVVQDDQTLKKA